MSLHISVIIKELQRGILKLQGWRVPIENIPSPPYCQSFWKLSPLLMSPLYYSHSYQSGFCCWRDSHTTFSRESPPSQQLLPCSLSLLPVLIIYAVFIEIRLDAIIILDPDENSSEQEKQGPALMEHTV